MASGKIKTDNWRLLWTNPNPSNTFAEQTISLDLSAYSEFMVIFNSSNTAAGQTVRFPFSGFINGDRWRYADATYAGSAVAYEYRDVTPTSSGITFGDGYRNSSVNNAVRIPYQIFAK